MRIVFTTDLHGHRWKYDRILEVALEYDAHIVINGGDMLPGNIDLTRQGSFITNYFDKHLAQYESENIYYICIPGNDDLKRFDPLLDVTIEKYPLAANIAQNIVQIDKFEFIGMNLLADYPYRLKDRCRMDNHQFHFPEQYGKGLLSIPTGWEDLEDWFSHAKTLPTIEEELNKLVKPKEMNNTIYVMHMPPCCLGLDKSHKEGDVGSKSIYNFLRKNQPLLSLHGHAHYSPDISGKWKEKVGKTTCIQPGQILEGIIYVLGDLETMEFERFTEKKE